MYDVSLYLTFNAQWMLGNLGKMAPSTIQKLRATMTGRDTQDDSLITEVK